MAWPTSKGYNVSDHISTLCQGYRLSCWCLYVQSQPGCCFPDRRQDATGLDLEDSIVTKEVLKHQVAWYSRLLFVFCCALLGSNTDLPLP